MVKLWSITIDTYKLKYEGTKSTLYWCTLNKSNSGDCTSKIRVYKATDFREWRGCHGQICDHRNKSDLNKYVLYPSC